jgi:hypothetical protein
MKERFSSKTVQRCFQDKILSQQFSQFAIPYHPNLSKSLRKVFEPFNIRTVQTSSIFKIKNKLESTKSKIPELEKSGIYQISCKTQRCGYKYIGQSRRQIQTRFVEHLRAFKNKKPDKSAVAQHMLKKDDISTILTIPV